MLPVSFTEHDKNENLLGTSTRPPPGEVSLVASPFQVGHCAVSTCVHLLDFFAGTNIDPRHFHLLIKQLNSRPISIINDKLYQFRLSRPP